MDTNRILKDIRSKTKKKVIIDTDAFNEIDDQYAMAYALASGDDLEVLSINAAPFENERSSSYEDGMLRSFDEIRHVLDLAGRSSIPSYKGSRKRIYDTGEPEKSPAAVNIINTVLAEDGYVYILAQGAISNVASAFMLEPAIREKAVVIWLGMNEKDSGNHCEFNFMQDTKAGQLFFECCDNIILCPAMYVTSDLLTNRELTEKLNGKSGLSTYLYEITSRCYKDSSDPDHWVRTIWDLAAPGILVRPECASLTAVNAPVLDGEVNKTGEDPEHRILYLDRIDRDILFKDVWAKIAAKA
jgi:purine nucleosidase